VRGLSSIRPFVKEAVQTENPAPIFSGASFWNDTENLWHRWPPVQFDTIVNGRPTVYAGHHVKEEEKDELGNFMSLSFVKRQYIKMWLQHLPSR